MKIAILTAHYYSRSGYLESLLADVLSGLNHQVTVITSTLLSPSLSGLAQPETDELPYVVHRIKPVFSLGANVWARGLVATLDKLQPDLVLIIGMAKFFAYPALYSHWAAKCVLFWGNNTGMTTWKNAGLLPTLNRVIGQKLLRGWMYKRAIRRAKRLVLYTPSTAAIVQRIIGKAYMPGLRAKAVEISLGFDNRQFFFSAQEAEKWRKENKLKNSRIIITVTRTKAYKGLEELIDKLDLLLAPHANWHYVLLGLTPDEYGQKLQAYAAAKLRASQISLLPFSEADVLRAALSAADFGLWTGPAISIQQAMGTGLPVLLPNDASVQHLAELNLDCALYLPENLSTKLNAQMQSEAERIELRAARAGRASAKLSFQARVEEYLDIVP